MAEVRPLNALEKIQEMMEFLVQGKIDQEQFQMGLGPVRKSLDAGLDQLRQVTFPATSVQGPTLQAASIQAFEVLSQHLAQAEALTPPVDRQTSIELLDQIEQAYSTLQQALRATQQLRQQS